MKVKVGQLRNISDVFSNPEIMGQRIDGVVSHHIFRIMEKIAPELSAFTKAHKQLLEQYGEKDADGKIITEEGSDGSRQYKISDFDAFTKEYEKIASQEIELDIEPLTRDILDMVKFSWVEAGTIDPILEDEK